MPDIVIKIAHILPSYYYIKNNTLIEALEDLNTKTLTPVIQNLVIVLAFSIVFIVITNIISSRKRKIG